MFPPIFSNKPHLSALTLLSALALSACVDTSSTGPSAPSTNDPLILQTFEKACANPDRSMRHALSVFSEAGYAYDEPFVSNSSSSRHNIRNAEIRIPEGTATPERGDRKWDTTLLGCTLVRNGTFAANLHRDVLQIMTRSGFRSVEALTSPATSGDTQTQGIYVRNGIHYQVTLGQVISEAPDISQKAGNIRYVRGNSKTFIAITSQER